MTMRSMEKTSMETIINNATDAAIKLGTSTTDTFDKLYRIKTADMIKVALRIAIIEMKQQHDNDIKTLRERIDALENRPPAANYKTTIGKPSYLDMTKRNHIVNLAAAEIKTRKKKESNIVIVGLKESTNLSDEELVNEFFDAIEVSKDEILHVRRYKKREKTQNSSQQGDQNTTERVGVIQVVLKSAITQHEALRRGNYHNIEGFNESTRVKIELPQNKKQ
jgi:hypothetical protein